MNNSSPIFSNNVIDKILALFMFQAICDMYGIEDMEK